MQSLANVGRAELERALREARQREAWLKREEKRAAKDAEFRRQADKLAKSRATERRNLMAMIAQHEQGRDAVAVKAAKRQVNRLEAEFQL